MIKLTKYTSDSIEENTLENTLVEYIHINPNQIIYLEQISTANGDTVTEIKMVSNISIQVLELPSVIQSKIERLYKTNRTPYA